MRQRVERNFPAVRAAVGFHDVFKEALERKFGERHRRMLAARGEAAGGDGRERYVSVPDFLLFIGLDIEKKRDAMVQADLALAERRRIRREACDSRDRRKRRLYDARVKFKQEAQKKLGRKRWQNAIMIKGETPRHPLELTRQAGLDLSWASGPHPPRLGLDQYPVDWAAMAAPLAPLRDDLEAAVVALDHESSLVTGALVDRIDAMEAFDDWYAKGSRTLETTYVLLGLPTLAAAVRPHLKGTAAGDGGGPAAGNGGGRPPRRAPSGRSRHAGAPLPAGGEPAGPGAESRDPRAYGAFRRQVQACAALAPAQVELKTLLLAMLDRLRRRATAFGHWRPYLEVYRRLLTSPELASPRGQRVLDQLLDLPAGELTERRLELLLDRRKPKPRSPKKKKWRRYRH